MLNKSEYPRTITAVQSLILNYQHSYNSNGNSQSEVGREGTYLKVVDKRYILVWNNKKYQSTILHNPGFTLPETSINQVQEGITKLYIIFA